MNWDKALYVVLACFTLCAPLAAQESLVPTENGVIRITPVVHASLQLEYNGVVIQVDPWSAVDLENVSPADIILISDDVDHHLDIAAVRRLSKSNTAIIMPKSGETHLPYGQILNNGDVTVVQGIRIESVAAYDIIPGEPSHLKGDANAYLIELGGKRILLAGVTECVPEIRNLGRVDIAFMPMNIPLGRMTPSAAAECTRALAPEVVFVYHYDQGYPRRLLRPDSPAPVLPGGVTVNESIQLFQQELEGTGIEFRRAEWYPQHTSRAGP